MTFSKAANLLRVADMATSRYDGIRLQDVTDEIGCEHRTAHRTMHAFEAVFPQVKRHWASTACEGGITCASVAARSPVSCSGNERQPLATQPWGGSFLHRGGDCPDPPENRSAT
ncbi:MAG: hypothetical protein CL814_05325 [Confluentimicrobium sp.]|nr:hypothetical protein [Actibacterium sp.]